MIIVLFCNQTIDFVSMMEKLHLIKVVKWADFMDPITDRLLGKILQCSGFRPVLFIIDKIVDAIHDRDQFAENQYRRMMTVLTQMEEKNA